MQTNVSEVARIRDRIAAECMAAKLGLEGLSYGTSRHTFITERMENMGKYHEQLQDLVGDGAIALVAETINAVPDTLTRSEILAVLRRELRPEEVESFCASLQEVWKAIDLFDAPVDLESVAFAGVDLLKDRFGDETACKLIFAPCTTGPLGDEELEQRQKEAAKYASEPGRFMLLFVEIEVKADQSNALIMYNDGDWSCSCDFFNTQRTCEHVMAVGRVFKAVPIVQPRGNLEDT